MKTLSKQLMSLFLALTMVFSLSATAFAAETSSVSNISDHEINVTMDDILSLKPFVIREANGTLSIDVEAAKKNGANLVAIEALTQHFAVINPEILKGTLSFDENLNVIDNQHPIMVPRSEKYSSCKGVNSFNTYWWGYQRYADYCESKRIVSDLNTFAAGATMVGGAAGIVAVIPVTMPVAGAIAAGAAFDAGYWWLLATRIDANNEGRGTIINLTHIGVFDIEPQ